MSGTIPEWSERTRDDCLRASVAAAYGVPYDETPAVSAHARNDAWGRWALVRGLQWCASWEYAPISLPGWIAIVDGLCPDGRRRAPRVRHAVAMAHDQLLLEPSAAGPGAYTAVLPTDVRLAMWLVPVIEQLRHRGRVWRIPNGERSSERRPGIVRAVPGIRPGNLLTLDK